MREAEGVGGEGKAKRSFTAFSLESAAMCPIFFKATFYGWKVTFGDKLLGCNIGRVFFWGGGSIGVEKPTKRNRGERLEHAVCDRSCLTVELLYNNGLLGG